MEKETRLDDESSDNVADESTYLLKIAESEKTKYEAGNNMNDKSDEDNKEDTINFSRMKKDMEEEETQFAKPSDNDKDETQFVEPPDNDKEETQFVEPPDSDEKDDDNFLYPCDWIRQNIRTKVKVKSDKDDEEDVIKEVQTNSFGILEFEGAARFGSSAAFLRLSDDTPANIIFDYVTEQYGTTLPENLIYIAGGAKYFKMKEDLKELIVDTFRKITQSQCTWVITAGTNTGVSEFVGKILRGSSCMLISTSTWGTLANTDSLYVNNTDATEFQKFCYNVDSSLTDWGKFLTHNHKFHLLVDDASTGEYGKEIPLVSRLVKYVTYKKDRKVPSIMLLLDVGVNSLENVISVVAGEQPIPVLIVDGLGSIEHVLTYAMQRYDEIDLSGEKLHKGLVEFITKNIGLDEDSQNIYMNVLKCLEHRHKISVVTLNKEEGLDVKILKAIMEHYDLTNEQRLQYTVLWNQVDMAEYLLLDASIKWERKSLQDSMVMALALNRYEFVEYFVNHNVSIHELVTQPLLEFLYGHRSSRERSTVKYHVAISPPKSIHHRFIVLVKSLYLYTPKYYEHFEIVSYKNILNILALLCKKMNFDLSQGYATDGSRTEDDDELNWYSTYPYRDIFLWAVVNNMQDMAKVLWKLGDEQIAKAIVAAEINRKLAEKAEEDNLNNDLVNMFKKNEIEFRELALKVLDSSYTENKFEAKSLLTSQLYQFRRQNNIGLANESCFQEFIAHKAVQQVLKELWFGNLRYEDHLIRINDYWKSYLKSFDRAIQVTGKTITYKEHSPAHRTYMLQDGQQRYNESDNQNKHLIAQYLSYPFDAPVRKFIRSLVSYCIFLMLISYCAVLKKEDTTPNVTEIVVFVWIISYAVEELYQVSVTSDATISHKLCNHLKSFFNVVDLTALTLYLIAFALQLNSSSMEYGHLLYAIDAMLWIVRLLQYFYASKILGTYVIMIGKMTIDMCYFISILLVFLLAYGVLSSAILRPETRIFNMIKNIVYFPYFNIYGELFADNDSSPGMTKFGTKVINDYAEPISWFFLGLFLLVANVLLMNLLIAVFGNTFAEVKKKADQIWRFHRHDLITEYALKLSFPPPFTVFIYIWKKISTCKKSPEQVHFNTPFRRNELNDFQRKNCMNVLRVQKTELKKDTINEKLEKLNEQNKTLQEQTKDFNKTMGTKMDKMESYLTDIRAINEKNS